MNLKSRLLLSLLLLTGALTAPAAGVKYVFLLIGDGYGTNHARLATAMAGRDLVMAGMPVHTLLGTTNVTGGVTDSAAAGTAIACGVKTYNGAIGVDQEKQPVENIAEKLRKQGFRIGLISSSPLTDATPAVFYAHQEKRTMRKEIGLDLAASDIAFVGGAGVHDKTTLDDLREAGWEVIEGDDVLARVRPGVRTFVNKPPYTPWPGDTAPDTVPGPTLAEYLTKAIEMLDHPGGFFIMLENGRIDYAGHVNDAAMVWREALEFEKAVSVALDFQARRPAETLVIVTADHETGGLQLESLDHEKAQILAGQQSPLADPKWALEVLAQKLEGLDPGAVRRQRIGSLAGALETNLGMVLIGEKRTALEQSLGKALDAGNPRDLLGQTVKQTATARDTTLGVRFTAGGHTSARVALHAQGAEAERFRDARENTDIHNLIRDLVLPGSSH